MIPLPTDGPRFTAVASPADTLPAHGPRFADATAESARFERVLQRLARAIDHGESVVSGVAAGRFATLDAGTLIALQAGIYRYSEAVDLTVRLVERATSAAKTVLEGGR